MSLRITCPASGQEFWGCDFAAHLFKTVNNYALAAIPFFILGGDLIMHGGLADKFIQFIKVGMGKIQGGLGVCVILASMFFAACNGSSVATCAALGRNTTELLEKEGYPKRITAGLVAVGGTLGLMIPPSLTMILIGVMQGIPIVTLFTAGIVPGIFEGTILAMLVWLLSKRFGWGKMPEVPEIKGEKPQNRLFPVDILETGGEQLTEELKQASHHRVGKKRAEALMAAARESIGVKEGFQGA